MKSSGVSVVSRIMRRENASRRILRMRTRGNWPGRSEWLMGHALASKESRLYTRAGPAAKRTQKPQDARQNRYMSTQKSAKKPPRTARKTASIKPAVAMPGKRRVVPKPATARPVLQPKQAKPADFAPDSRPRCGWSYSGMSASYIAYHD